MQDLRNPHVGAPFTDDDAAIAAALEDVSVPVLLCSLVHMTGDPSWIRDVSLPRMPGTMDLQGGLDDDVLADLRRRAVPAIAAYRDGGCVPHELPEDVVVEMFAFLAGTPLDEDVMVPMFVEDMQFDGADSGAISWGDEVSDEAKAASPVVVIGCGLSGILAGIRLTQAGLPFVIVEKDEGPGGTWWENRYPGRASTSAVTTTATRSSRRTTGPSTTASSPSCATTSSACSTPTSFVRGVASAPR